MYKNSNISFDYIMSYLTQLVYEKKYIQHIKYTILIKNMTISFPKYPFANVQLPFNLKLTKHTNLYTIKIY